jgi:hypothetical protein
VFLDVRELTQASGNSQDDSSDWLITDNVASWTGTPADQGWRFLRQSLERQDSAEIDYKYAKVTLDTILAFGQSSLVPPWLVQSLEVRLLLIFFKTDCIKNTFFLFQVHNPEYLIRTFLRYDDLQSALEQSLSMMRKVCTLFLACERVSL